MSHVAVEGVHGLEQQVKKKKKKRVGGGCPVEELDPGDEGLAPRLTPPLALGGGVRFITSPSAPGEAGHAYASAGFFCSHPPRLLLLHR